jgi:hypothetical protein
MSMRAIAVLVGLAIALSACDRSPGAYPGAPPGPVPEDGSGQTVDQRSVAAYSAVIRQLLTRDYTVRTFEIKRVYVVDGVVEDAADPHVGGDVVREHFTAGIKDGIADALADLPSVEFVADPDSVIVGKNKCCVKNGGVLISLGPVTERAGGRVAVANGLFLAGKGGQWLTYVLESAETSWRAVGTTGPVILS